MGDNYHTTFYFKQPFKLKFEFLKNNIISKLEEKGISYTPAEGYKYLGYWSDVSSKWFESDNIDEILNILCQENGGGIGLWWDKVRITFLIRPVMGPSEFVNCASISIDRVYFREELRGEKVSLQVIKLNKYLYSLLDPMYEYGEVNIGTGDIPYTSYDDAKIGDIKAIYWSNFFGPQLVEKYGREKLLSAPSWKTEELSNGGIMLVRSPNPFTIDEPYIKAEEIEKYLGIR